MQEQLKEGADASEMKILNLYDNNLNNESIQRLKPALKHAEELHLGRNKMITSVGIRYVAEGLKGNAKVRFI